MKAAFVVFDRMASLDFIGGQGGTAVLLQVDDDNRAAIELYRKMGFTHMATHTAWVRPASMRRSKPW